MPSYSEHDKLQKIKDKSQIIGEFLEFVTRKGYVVCELVENESDNHLWEPMFDPIERLLALYFDIDLKGLRQEAARAYEEQRNLNKRAS